MLKQVLFGIATNIPGVYNYCSKGTGGTNSARYCYSVWLRHLVMAEKKGLNTCPKVVAELGPGDSLGIGLAALISGCDRYYAFDVVKHAYNERNLQIFDELVTLFQNREQIPSESEFPEVKPYLDDYSFPKTILNENRLRTALESSRLAKIRDSIADLQHNNTSIKYIVPWYDPNVISKESVDMIYSQAVLEHVDDLKNTYKAMYLWLKPNGYISHTIDFKSHGTASEWNGHWMYSDFMWKIIRGKRPYLLNREPHSTHIEMLNKEGFEILADITVETKSNLQKENLNPKFKYFSDKDLITSGTFIQAIKK